MTLKRKLTYITVGYWFLLIYIIAALVWWFIALNRQSNEMVSLKLSQLSPAESGYDSKLAEVERFRKRKVAQYAGEGVIFMLLIAVGAVFVYRATRKQLQLAQQQQNFMMAITHELKTPIAVTKLNIETLQKRKLDETRQQQLLQIALMETDRLNDLTNNILLASRMEGGEQLSFFEVIDLSALAADLLRQFRLRYPDRIFELNCQPESAVLGDPLLIKIMLSNLLDNAVKYAPTGEPIHLICTSGEKGVVIKVADRGMGIPPDERKKIFEKFYRIGNEATRSAKGTGLGLYLCDRIARSHKGKIILLDNQPSGSVFEVSLPAFVKTIEKDNRNNGKDRT